MFIYDIPIDNEEDDFLGRSKFATRLSTAIIDWKGKESFVIALYGEWGSGKTSIIKLAKKAIEEVKILNKPTIIDFNPWLFSDLDNLTKNFFIEVSKELGSRKDSANDKILAEKIKQYSNLLNLVPEKSFFTNLSSKILLLLGMIGLSSSQILQWVGVNANNIKTILFSIGLFFIFIEFSRELLKNAASYLDYKINSNEKSVNTIREEIRAHLLKRDKKLIIIIDDIDRLNPDEIKEIFRLVKSNTDFPNTIFLLSFDRTIIEKNLESQPGINGKDYLEKIVQVNFDIPYALPQKISQFLFKELDKILIQLPESREKLFDKTYWTNIYHSGYKYFFNNIRDVKRYINSLSFNISLMYKGKSMEVNPIDFFAIEAIRVFTPEFYAFMKKNKKLFTDTTSNSFTLGTTRKDIIEQRKLEISEVINSSNYPNKDKLKELLVRLFPQLEGVFGNMNYSDASKPEWSRNLRVCSEDYFDAYFTLIPGGSDEELSQYEIDSLLSMIDNADDLENELRNYIGNGKIRKVLNRLQDYTSEKEIIPQSAYRNISLALFNISDEIPFERLHMSDFGADMDIMRIIYQLGKREKIKENNFEIFKEIIPISKGILGPVKKMSLEIPREKNTYEKDYLFPENKLDELKDLVVKKIYEYYSAGKLISHPEFLYILYRWKEWGGEEYKKFIDEINSTDEGFISFISKFIYKQKSQSFGDYGEREYTEFNAKSIIDFVDLKYIRERLLQIIASNNELYKANKKEIDFVLSKSEQNVEEG